MADDALRELERAWRDGGGLEAGQRYLHALDRAGADARRGEVQQAVLALQLTAAGLDATSLAVLDPIPEGTCYRLDVAGAEAITTWKTLRAQVAAPGFWPVLLGTAAEVDWLDEAVDIADEAPVAELLAAVDEANDVLAHGAAPLAQLQSDGEWPDDASPRHDFAVAVDLVSREFHPQVVLALLPTREGAEAAAWLRFGGFNDCPHPAEHVKALRSWNDRYGAEVLAISHDTLECHVEHPPTDRRDAMQLAREQHAYCEDIVSQGTESLARLAAGLLGGTAWFFWWD